MGRIWVSDSLDNLNLAHVRLLQCAAAHGPVQVLLWSDQVVQRMTGRPPKFPLEERRYVAEAIRYADQVRVADNLSDPRHVPVEMIPGDTWVMADSAHTAPRQDACREGNIACVVIDDAQLAALPPVAVPPDTPGSDRQKVVVTGCFDWFHSGHIRFFEEAADYGDLYVIVGHDRNVRELKGPGHPLFNEHHRWTMVQAIRYVTAAMISTGHGWMDAEPEIARIRPNRYIVNEDGDRPEKRQFCAERDIEYIVLRRRPKPGLPRRESTHLRGF